jgi:hypothetical protein
MEFIHKKKAEKARTKMLKYVSGFDHDQLVCMHYNTDTIML